MWSGISGVGKLTSRKEIVWERQAALGQRKAGGLDDGKGLVWCVEDERHFDWSGSASAKGVSAATRDLSEKARLTVSAAVSHAARQVSGSGFRRCSQNRRRWVAVHTNNTFAAYTHSAGAQLTTVTVTDWRASPQPSPFNYGPDSLFSAVITGTRANARTPTLQLSRVYPLFLSF